MKTIEILKLSRKLIENPERWCQGKLAVSRDGEYCEPKNPSAQKWCAYGAVQCIANNETETDVAECVLRDAANELFGVGASIVNDTEGFEKAHANVLRAYDHAIARARVL